MVIAFIIFLLSIFILNNTRFFKSVLNMPWNGFIHEYRLLASYTKIGNTKLGCDYYLSVIVYFLHALFGFYRLIYNVILSPIRLLSYFSVNFGGYTNEVKK